MPLSWNDKAIEMLNICFKDFIYLFIRDTHRERERSRDLGRGRSRLHAGSPMWDLIPDPGIMP